MNPRELYKSINKCLLETYVMNEEQEFQQPYSRHVLDDRAASISALGGRLDVKPGDDVYDLWSRAMNYIDEIVDLLEVIGAYDGRVRYDHVRRQTVDVSDKRTLEQILNMTESFNEMIRTNRKIFGDNWANAAVKATDELYDDIYDILYPNR